MKREWLGVMVLGMAALGCGLIEDLPGLLGGQEAPVVGEAGEVLFSDDFSDAGSGWDIVEGNTDYFEDAYRIYVEQASYDRWANPGRNFTGDIRIDVDITKAGGPDDNNFGVQCRYHDNDGFDYYGFQISSDGYVWIQRVDDGTPVGLSSEKMQPSDAVLQGAATNHLTVYCTGSELSLWVNGQKVASATDSTYPDGDVGFIAGTYETPGTDMRFDNLLVQAE